MTNNPRPPKKKKTPGQIRAAQQKKIQQNLGYSLDPEIVEKYDRTAYIVGGGPSLKGFKWELLDDKFVVAINRAYEVLPNAQIVYFTDKDFWDRHKNAMLEHKGQLIRGALVPEREPYNEHVRMFRLTKRNGYVKEKGCIAHGSNSTYAALNMLAAHLGFKKIYLLGIDMKWGQKGNKGTSHWHDGHRRIDPESGYQGFMRNFDTLKKPLKEAGVKVLNINSGSALKTFKQVTFEEVFGDGARTTGRQGGETPKDTESGQTSPAVRKDRKEAMRVQEKESRPKPVAPKRPPRTRAAIRRRQALDRRRRKR